MASGEDYLTTARREVAEELGISPELVFASKTLVRSIPETEMTAIYLARADGPYRFHPTETAGGTLFACEAIQRGVRDGSLLVTPALGVVLDELGRLRASGSLPALLRRL